MLFSDNFKPALEDYLFLLERKYPQKAILKIIGDHYALTATDRSLLFRGVCIREEAQQRRLKMAEPASLPGNTLHVDGFNVILTIGSYLNGSPVYVGMDGILRDASEIHGKIFRNELNMRSVQLVIDFLSENNCPEVYFYLDSPVSMSGEFCKLINSGLSEHKLKGKAETFVSPDFILKNLTDGIISTSDSTIIDKTNQKVIDLPRLVLERFFEPKFMDLNSMISF
jgi:hypothetical protein